jgi:hypothetical protein
MCKFEKTTGLLTLVEYRNKLIPLSNGPLFVSAEKKVKKVSAISEADGTVSILSVFENEADSIIWNIHQNGLVTLKAYYQPLGNAPYTGITFSFPEKEVSSMKWMGQGPYRVWKNRMQYTNFGVWEMEYNNTITGFSDYVYPEFKGYHADVYWAEIKDNDSLGFKVYTTSNDIFLRLLTPEKPENEANTALDFPPGDISFLKGINAIGTKFKAAQKLGPQSSNYVFRPNHFYHKKLKINLFFDFRFYGEKGKY